MKVSYQWLAEYVDLTDLTAAELAEKLTRSGIEVDVVENRNKGVEQVYVGYVKSREKHPDADKLSVCIVDAGQGEDLQIVCGAANIQAGQKVPVAIVGAVLPGDFKIKQAKLRGVESQGMICSAKELGLNDRLLPKELQEGILVLPEETTVGANIVDVLAIRDEVLELDLTPNRSDCLSMIGTAYEIAAIMGRAMKLSDPEEGLIHSASTASDFIHVKISAEEQCSLYAARYIENVKIGLSPLWMQNRLMAAGLRPINNIVDITNYVMMEYGQPLHAFDADRLDGGRIDVRLARDGERIVTLDDASRALEPHMLLVTDGAKPIAIAGVMGGANSEVTEATSRIVLESAQFAGSSVRRTSRQLGLRSEASLRFEKEVDPQAVIPALNRAAALMSRYAGATVAEGIVQSAQTVSAPRVITLSVDSVNRYLGTSISSLEMKAIFTRLHFTYEAAASEEGGITLNIHVPSRRGDITRDVDLIEEIARLYGYDNIPTSLMSGVTTPGSLSREQTIRRSIRNLLTRSGIHEVVNYAFTHPQHISRFPGLFPDAQPIALAMPMSEERSTLRTSLLPHLLETAVYNRNRSIDDIAIFEIGPVFVTAEKQLTKLPQERSLLSILWTGSRQTPHWSGKSVPIDFYDIKGIVEKLTEFIGIEGVHFTAAEPKGFHPGRAAEIYCTRNGVRTMLGTIGQVHPDLQREHDLSETYIAEIALAPLYDNADFRIECSALPRYPSISRDIAVVVNAGVHVGDMISQIKQTAGSLLESIQVFDLYSGERLGSNRKSVAFALVYRHADRTLTDEEVSNLQERVVSGLEQSFAAELRK